MKNSSRKTTQKTPGKKTVNKDQAQTVKKPDKEREVLYKVVTKRDSDIIKAFITFTYRVLHPQVTTRMLFYGLLILVPGFFIKIQWLSITCFVLGALIILVGLFRQYISLALTKKSDEDYINGSEFVYEFTQNDASFYRNGELAAYSSKYKDIDAVFYDEKYYYLSLRNRDFFVIPMDRFTIGDPSTFGDFMYKRCKKVCRWIPVKFSNRIKKMQSQRAIARDQLNKMNKK